MLLTVQNRWPTGARFAFNCYKYWVNLLLYQYFQDPVLILRQEGFTQEDHLSMVLYGITLSPLVEELRAADLALLESFYANNMAFDGSAQQSKLLLTLLLD